MMHSQNGAARYREVRNRGLVAEASPARLVQIVHEQMLGHLATAEGCMQRIRGNLPLEEVVAKGAAIGAAVRMISHLDATLDIERGGEIALNLRNLYAYILSRLTQANATNDAAMVAEVSQLVRTLKVGWDQVAAENR